MNKQYKKIDIYLNGKYKCSTTWSKTCREAIRGYIEKHNPQGKVTAFFAQ